jgi:hypothetical protein
MNPRDKIRPTDILVRKSMLDLFMRTIGKVARIQSVNALTAAFMYSIKRVGSIPTHLRDKVATK